MKYITIKYLTVIFPVKLWAAFPTMQCAADAQ